MRRGRSDEKSKRDKKTKKGHVKSDLFNKSHDDVSFCGYDKYPMGRDSSFQGKQKQQKKEKFTIVRMADKMSRRAFEYYKGGLED